MRLSGITTAWQTLSAVEFQYRFSANLPSTWVVRAAIPIIGNAITIAIPTVATLIPAIVAVATLIPPIVAFAPTM